HAVALDADEPLALLVRALLDGERGQYQQAADAMRRVLASQAGHEDVPTLLYAITVYGLADDLVSAQIAASRAAELAPGSPGSYVTLSQTSYRRRDLQGAMAALLDGLAHCPTEQAQEELAGAYCQLLVETRQLDRAIAFGREHLGAVPADSKRQLRLATLH